MKNEYWNIKRLYCLNFVLLNLNFVVWLYVIWINLN